MRRRDRRDRPDRPAPTTAQSGALSARDIERLKAEGAVASVCTSYLDRRGRVLDLELCERSIGQTLGQLDRCRTIALAIGRSKVASIRAALSSGYIDVFITDLETARATIEEPED
ncbi:MAG: sugar-binding domain-containing protein [Anaerotruncus massiliensis (ex Togo et al. 2019)]